MKSAVLEFQQGRAKRQQAEGDVDILKTIAELRSHLESLDRAIIVVEHLALAQMGQDAGRVWKASSRKNSPTSSKGKGRVVAFRRLRQIDVGKDTLNAVPV
jgi:hypothetical protein